MAEPLSKQVEDPAQDPRLAAMKQRIGALQILYFVLFATSLVLIIYNYQVPTTGTTHMLWAFALGAAVLTRLIRQSMVNRYNSIINGGRQGPLV